MDVEEHLLPTMIPYLLSVHCLRKNILKMFAQIVGITTSTYLHFYEKIFIAISVMESNVI